MVSGLFSKFTVVRNASQPQLIQGTDLARCVSDPLDLDGLCEECQTIADSRCESMDEANIDGKSRYLVDGLKNVCHVPMRIFDRSTKFIANIKFFIVSTMDRALLRATVPDDDGPNLKYVNVFLNMSANFPAYMEAKCIGKIYKEDPYWMMLMKIWYQMTSRDWRVVAKSLYLLHRLSRDSTCESWNFLRNSFMVACSARVFCYGIPGTKIFSTDSFNSIPTCEKTFIQFLKMYATFVYERLRFLSPDMSCNLYKVQDFNGRHEFLCAVMDKYGSMLMYAFTFFESCATELHEDSIIPSIDSIVFEGWNVTVAHCLYLFYQDTVQLWKIYNDLIALLSNSDSRSELTDIERFKAFRDNNEQYVLAMVTKSIVLSGKYNLSSVYGTHNYISS
jgi:hypothetical protein